MIHFLFLHPSALPHNQNFINIFFCLQKTNVRKTNKIDGHDDVVSITPM
jgi:hypothetical protein